MFEMFFYGSILLVLCVVFLFGTDAGFTVGFLIILLTIIILLIKIPRLALILIVILIALLIVRAIRRNLNTGSDGNVKKYKGGEAEGCLIAGLGMLLMLPGAIAVFVVLVLKDFVFLAGVAALACMFVGWRIMELGLKS